MPERRTISEVRARSDRGAPTESRRPIGFTVNGHRYYPAPGRIEWAIARLFVRRRDLMFYSLARSSCWWRNVLADLGKWLGKPVRMRRWEQFLWGTFCVLIGTWPVVKHNHVIRTLATAIGYAAWLLIGLMFVIMIVRVIGIAWRRGRS